MSNIKHDLQVLNDGLQALHKHAAEQHNIAELMTLLIMAKALNGVCEEVVKLTNSNVQVQVGVVGLN